MLARIKCHQHLSKSLGYNEKKVVSEKAVCLGVVNFIKSDPSLTFGEKLARFDQRTSLHDMSKCNAVHISLNFSTKGNLSDEKLRQLAEYYMKAIGFDRQPYVVYRHYDAYQPHVHVVSANITAEGRRIQLNDVVNTISRQVTAEMEDRFSLTKNVRQTDQAAYQQQSALQVARGEAGIKAGISDVLNAVLPHYNYTNFGEVGAVLRLYNVAAHRGEVGSQLYKSGGLLYYALDQDGARASVPLKASSFLLKPTLKYLEGRFEKNLAERKEMGLHIDSYLNWILEGTRLTWDGFRDAMEKEGISVVVQADKRSGVNAVFFVHHAQKFVLAGESLGAAYSLQGLQERCGVEEQQEEGLRLRLGLRV